MSEGSVRRRQSEVEEESYFISMSDMLVGLLFVFIILLVYFALTFKQKEDYLVGAGQARKTLLEQLRHDIKRELGVDVSISDQTGILSLPEKILFKTNEYELNDEGVKSIRAISNIMARRLPCYTDSSATNLKCAGIPDSHKIDTILIEGHADNKPVRGDTTGILNFDLSTLRATRTYLALTQAQPGLDKLTNGDKHPTPVLGVAGYGPNRPARDDLGNPIPDTQPERHRRIDLRFIMVTPKRDEVRKTSKMLIGQ